MTSPNVMVVVSHGLGFVRLVAADDGALMRKRAHGAL